MAVEERRKNDMMAHLLDSLDAGKDIGQGAKRQNFGFWILDFGLNPIVKTRGLGSGRFECRCAAAPIQFFLFSIPEVAGLYPVILDSSPSTLIQNPKSKIQNRFGHFLSEDELISYLQKDANFSEEKGRSLAQQVLFLRDYNPPRRERVLEWQQKQNPICPHSDDLDSCNV